MFLFKVFQEFLLPSVFVLVLILAGLIFLWKKKGKTGKVLIIIGLSLYYLFSITPVADLILLPLESKYQPVNKEALEMADKIVFLLGAKESDILRASEVIKISNIKNQKSPKENKFPTGQAKIIISGTNPLNPEINEAEEVKEFLAERGVSPENIILEDKSRNTFESAKNIKEMLGDEPFFLVTSAYHLPRGMETFRKMGLNPIPAPADFKIKKYYDILDFFPNAENLRNSDLAFHEYFGILFYKFLEM